MPGEEANKTLWDARELVVAETGRVTTYEMVLSTDDPIAELTATWPKLEQYLLSKKDSVPPSRSVIIGVWRDSKLFVFDGPSFWDGFLAVAGEALESYREGMTPKQAEPSPNLLLPPPSGEN